MASETIDGIGELLQGVFGREDGPRRVLGLELEWLTTGRRTATADDLKPCDDLCLRVHGHDRHGELSGWIGAGTARVVERGGQITGYATGCGYLSHAVGEADDDIIALLQAAEMIAGLGFLVPSRNTRLMTWCLDSGLRLVQQSTLMSIGFYSDPHGSWLPSIGY